MRQILTLIGNHLPAFSNGIVFRVLEFLFPENGKQWMTFGFVEIPSFLSIKGGKKSNGRSFLFKRAVRTQAPSGPLSLFCIDWFDHNRYETLCPVVDFCYRITHVRLPGCFCSLSFGPSWGRCVFSAKQARYAVKTSFLFCSLALAWPVFAPADGLSYR